METQGTITGTEAWSRPRRRLTRGLLTAALACFALPFVTVTCYGDATVSGVQAATSVDLDTRDGRGEAQLMREEPANGFAMGALLVGAAALALTFAHARQRQTVVWLAAGGTILLVGSFHYAYIRSWGEAIPEFGLAGAIALFLGAAWSGIETVPTWLRRGLVALGLTIVVATSFGHDVTWSSPMLYLAFFAGSIVATGAAVGAICTSAGMEMPVARPGLARIVAAGVAWLVSLAIAAVAVFLVMAEMVSGEYGPGETTVGGGITFALVSIAMYATASVGGWAAVSAIARRRQIGATSIA
jgi:hypothetical protein